MPSTYADAVLPALDSRTSEGSLDEGRAAETARLFALARTAPAGEREQLENEIIATNLRVAHAIARSYRNRGIADDDLDQVAGLGLVKAVRGFDPTLGHDFLAFAVPTVRGELRRHFRDAGWAIRPPRPVQETQAKVTAAQAVLAQELGRAPRPAELAEHLGLPHDLVVDALGASGLFQPVSLDVPGDGASPTDTWGEVDPAYALTEDLVSLSPLVHELTDRERRIIELRYFADATQAQIGAELGVSQEQVSRLLSQILGRLRRQLAAA